MNKTHGMSNSRPYRIWQGILYRCTNESSKDYKRYGLKGISYDPRWQNFEAFWEEMKSEYKENLTLDRIDNTKGYTKENCRWVDMKKQCNNRKNNLVLEYKGEKLTAAEVCDKYGIKRSVLYDRLKNGWSIEKSIETKVNKEIIEYKDFKGTKKEFAYHFGIKYRNVIDRFRNGWTIEEVIEGKRRK